MKTFNLYVFIDSGKYLVHRICIGKVIVQNVDIFAFASWEGYEIKQSTSVRFVRIFRDSLRIQRFMTYWEIMIIILYILLNCYC